MAHFAKVVNGVVVDVIVAEQGFIDSLDSEEGTQWIETSYNTHGGVHYNSNFEPDGGEPLRKNFAGIGMTYDSDKDAFISVKPHSSWVLDEETCLWRPSIPMPNDGNRYFWDEEKQTWQQFNITE